MSRPNPLPEKDKPQGSSPYSRPRPGRDAPTPAMPEETDGGRKTDPPTAVRPDPIVPVEEPDEDAKTELRPALSRHLPPPPRLPSPVAPRLPTPGPLPVPRPFESVAPTALAVQPTPPRSGVRVLLASLGLMAGVAVGGAAGIIALWHQTVQVATPKLAAPPPVAPAATPSRASAPVACRLAHRAVELRPTVLSNVPLYAAPVPGSSHVALGYANSQYAATGLDVDPRTLRAEIPLSRMGVEPVGGVVPLARQGKLGFAIDRDDGGLESAHTISGKVPFRIGYADGSLSRLDPGGAPRAIWSNLARGKKPTGLRAATIAGVGHAITFRLGNDHGQVMMGWLGLDGARKSPLAAIDISAAALGTPSIAASGKSVAVAVATRSDELSPWGIRIARAAAGKLPVAARYFSLPKGGPGHDAFAPTLTGLDGGHWLLEWTEGTRGDHVVRAQTLDASLSPIGAAVTLSPHGTDAGQGVIQANGTQATGFYLVKARHGYQLWATSLDCK